MYGYNAFGFQGKYIQLIQKTFKNFDSIKSINDFMNSLSKNDINDFKILSNEANVMIPKVYRSGFWGMSKVDNIIHLEWKLMHKRFQILFCKTKKGVFISFLIPYESYSSSVKIEFTTHGTGYNGGGGLLHHSINPNAMLVFFENSTVGFPVVFLTQSQKLLNDIFFTEHLTNQYFKNPTL